MDFHIFKRKKKKAEPKALEPEPKAPPAAPKPPPPPPWPPQEVAHGNGPRPHIPGGPYMDELDRMSRVPRMRNLEVTTSRTFKWNFRDPMDGRDYEYYYQDQGRPMTYWGDMQRPPIQPPTLPPPPPPRYLEHGPRRPLMAPSRYYDYGYGGVPSANGLPYSGYYEDEYSRDCVVM